MCELVVCPSSFAEVEGVTFMTHTIKIGKNVDLPLKACQRPAH